MKCGRIQMEVVEAYLKLQSKYFPKMLAENCETPQASVPYEILTKDLINVLSTILINLVFILLHV